MSVFRCIIENGLERKEALFLLMPTPGDVRIPLRCFHSEVAHFAKDFIRAKGWHFFRFNIPRSHIVYCCLTSVSFSSNMSCPILLFVKCHVAYGAMIYPSKALDSSRVIFPSQMCAVTSPIDKRALAGFAYGDIVTVRARCILTRALCLERWADLRHGKKEKFLPTCWRLSTTQNRLRR